MDNVCTFIDWKIQGDVNISPLNNGGKKVTFAASSVRPNKAGVWNKHYFVAFGSTAETLEKCQIRPGSILTLITEEQVYIDKEGNQKNNYLVNNFNLSVRPQEKTANQPNNGAVPAETETSLPATGDIDGLDALMAEMN